MGVMLSILVAAVLLYVQVRAVHPRALLDAIAQTTPSRLILALSISLFFKTVHSAVHLRTTLRAWGAAPPWRPVLDATVGGLAVREVLPASGFNLPRSAYLARRHGVPLATAAAAELAMLWLKLGWLLLAGLGILWVPEVQDAYAMVSCAGLLGWLVLTMAAGPTTRRLQDWAPPDVQAWTSRLLRATRVTHPRAMVSSAAHAGLAVGSEWLVFGVVLWSLNHPVPPLALATLLPAISIVTKVPLSFMGLGVREGLVLLLFAPYASPDVLLASGLLFSTVDRLLPALFTTIATPTFLAHLAQGRSAHDPHPPP